MCRLQFSIGVSGVTLFFSYVRWNCSVAQDLQNANIGCRDQRHPEDVLIAAIGEKQRCGKPENAGGDCEFIKHGGCNFLCMKQWLNLPLKVAMAMPVS